MSIGDIKCRDCFGGPSHCSQCILETHRSHPFHRLLVSPDILLKQIGDTNILIIRDGQANITMTLLCNNLDSKFNSATMGISVSFPALILLILPSLTPAESITLPFHSANAWVLCIGVSSFCVPHGCLHLLIAQRVHSHLMSSTPFIYSHCKVKHRRTTITIRWHTSRTIPASRT